MSSQPNTKHIVLGVLGAVGALGVGLGLAYYFFQREPLDPKVEQLIALIKKTIQENGGHLSKASLIFIQELMGVLAQPEYVRIMIEGRTKRRQPGITDAEYEEIVKNTSKGIEELVDNKVAKALGYSDISEEAYQLAFITAVREEPRLSYIPVMILEQMRKDLPLHPNAPKMTVELARECLRFQVIIWSQIKLEVKDPEYASIVKQAKLADLTVEKFHIEEENLTSDELVKLDEECILLSKKLQEMISKDDPRNQGLEEAQDDGLTF